MIKFSPNSQPLRPRLHTLFGLLALLGISTAQAVNPVIQQHDVRDAHFALD